MPQPHKPILKKTTKAVHAMAARLKSLHREALKIEKELMACMNPGKHPPGQTIAANVGTTSESRTPKKGYRDCWKREHARQCTCRQPFYIRVTRVHRPRDGEDASATDSAAAA